MSGVTDEVKVAASGRVWNRQRSRMEFEGFVGVYVGGGRKGKTLYFDLKAAGVRIKEVYTARQR
jgi:hypothetical protein